MAWIREFNANGLCVIENFLSTAEVDALKREIANIIDKGDVVDDQRAIFITDDTRHIKDQYFIESVDKIRYFYEEGAIGENGKVALPKDRALNKIGHALHVLNPVFRRVTFSPKVKKLIEELRFVRPVVPQSMYIFKPPGIGGTVSTHMDASFLLCEPAECLVGVWLALDDANIENGCLWYAPGSHKGNKVTKKFVRKVDENTKNEILVFEGTSEAPPDDSFVPAPVAKGSCVLIHGLVWHKSEANRSVKQRHAYTFHVVDEGSSVWDKRAWLQPNVNYRFPPLFEITPTVSG